MLSFDYQKIEKKWQGIWNKEKIYEPNLKRAKKPFYNLMMFPYPSAEGLHVGNMYAFVGSDIYGRFKRMQGYDVFEPIGLDGFGIHSENYALKIGTHPAKQAKISEKRFYKQLQMIGNGFAWDEHLETYDPAYYKWTQWIFIQMFKNGLAFRKKQAVNWCPSCKTVLADEQVISGECERCSSRVIKRELEQWFFKITKYADRLLKNLEKIDWSEKVKIAQKEWIGQSQGVEIEFRIQNRPSGDLPKAKTGLRIPIFTTRPDTLFGATYLVLSPEHKIILNLKSQISNFKEVEKYIKKAKNKSEEERIAEAGAKTGVELKGIKAINPVNKREIPIFVADYVLASYGTGAIMAVPAHDERDFEFAKKYNLPIVSVINPMKAGPVRVYPSIEKARQKAPDDLEQSIQQLERIKAGEEVYTGDGVLINSGKLSGMPSEKARWLITKFVGGKKQIQYHLRDWLISRQRYWGAPIPMIYCQSCAKNEKGERKEMPGWYSVPENQLPVKLPYVENFRPKGKGVSPLASVKSFFEAKCPSCGVRARRETDVSDTFLDSAWYFFRYIDVKNKNQPFDKLRARKWLPVNMYIGGAEHSVLHLLYSRFLTMVFNDWRLLDFDEPFTKFRAHGLLIKEGSKMAKSKGNIVNPDEYVKKFGADVFRMYLMFLAPFERGGDFRDAGILGISRFLQKVYRFFAKNKSIKSECKADKNLERLFHQTIKKVTEDIENLRYNTTISSLMVLFNEMERHPQQCGNLIMKQFLKLLAPFAPFIAEGLWEKLGHKDSIHRESWPKYDPKLIREEKFELVIQINGKVRDKISVHTNISQKEAEKIVFSREKIKNWLKDKKVKKIIFVPNRLINFVLENG